MGGTFSKFQKSAKGDFDLDEMEGLDNVTWKNWGESASREPFQLGGVNLMNLYWYEAQESFGSFGEVLKKTFATNLTGK